MNIFKTHEQIEKIVDTFLNEFHRVPLHNIEAKKNLLKNLLANHNNQIADGIIKQCAELGCEDCQVLAEAFLQKV